MICENCNFPVKHGERHCKTCLRVVTRGEQDYEPDIIECPHCQRGVSPTQPYCVFCEGELEKVYIIKK